MTADVSNTNSEPRAERPVMPAAYGITEGPEGMLPWRWAEERLERPHVVAVWGLWVDRRSYFAADARPGTWPPTRTSRCT